MATSAEQLRQQFLNQILGQPAPRSAAEGISSLGTSLASLIAARRQVPALEAKETADRIGGEVRLRDALIGSGIGSEQAGAIASAPQDVRGALLSRLPQPLNEVQEAQLGEIRERTTTRRTERKQAERQKSAVQGLAQRVLSGEFGDLDQGQRLDALVAAQTGDAGGLQGLIQERGADFSVIGNKDQGLFRLNSSTGELQELVPPVSEEPDKSERAKLTASLRKEAAAIPAVKSYRKAVPAVKAALKSAGQDNKAADLDIVFAVMKAVDPESVVRESEQQVAIQAGSPAERFRGFWNEITGGGRLTAQVRQELLQVAMGRANSFRESALSDLSQFQGIADEAGVTAELAIPQLEPLPELGAIVGPGEAVGSIPGQPGQVMRFDAQGNLIQ